MNPFSPNWLWSEAGAEIKKHGKSGRIRRVSINGNVILDGAGYEHELEVASAAYVSSKMGRDEFDRNQWFWLCESLGFTSYDAKHRTLSEALRYAFIEPCGPGHYRKKVNA